MRKRCLITLVGVVWVSSGCAQVPAATAEPIKPAKPAGRYTYTLNAGGLVRTYSLRIPPRVNPNRPLPLVVLLHGWTMSGQIAEGYTKMAETADREGFALAAPDGLGDPKGWNAGFLDLSGKRADDAAFVMQMVDAIGRETSIDPQRIYVAGHSNGAMLAGLVATRFSQRIAAVGMVAGTVGLPQASGGTQMIPDPALPVSAIIIHGVDDETVAYDASHSALLKGVGAQDSARWWASKIGAGPASERTVGPDRRVITERWRPGRNGNEVVLISLRNGTHAWPGSQQANSDGTPPLDAATVLWKFFVEHPKR